jgi:NADPH-dependent 2,4-dienoyl-CoA reductase/sulfur reductase-like enzyme/rhodanese-related sulfurtransferase
MPVKVIIVGGVAGGASAAARLRRLSEDAEIIILERGEYVSFANCGLPYYLGGEIQPREKILVQTPQSLYERFRIDVRTQHEAVSIDKASKTVTIRHLGDGSEYTETYDHLVLSPGAGAVKPPLPGIDSAGIFTLKNVSDMDAIQGWIDSQRPKTVVVGGGGYIGLEVAEQLHHKGLNVTLVDGNAHVMSPFDADMASYLNNELTTKGIQLELNARINAFEPSGDAKSANVILSNNKLLPADLVVLGLGVRPETDLAKTADLALGQWGGIKVNEYLQTSEPGIWAIGDAIEVQQPLTGEYGLVALAGPANRQGRIVADNIMGAQRAYNGTYGTAIIRVFELTAAMTGLTEKAAKAASLLYDVVHLHPASHASYYPGAERLAIKMVFSPDSGKVLGAQIVGKDGVDKRIDVFAIVIQAGLSVEQVAELELAYAPPYGSAKDPVNLAGMIASNIRAGLLQQIQWHELEALDNNTYTLLDVRGKDETEQGVIPNAKVIPLKELRQRLSELPKEKLLITYCASGQRSYYASRILKQHGYQVKNLSGAYNTWRQKT